MSVDQWLLLGAGVWVGVSIFVILFVYTCFVVQNIPAEANEQEENHQLELDDEIRYLTFSTYLAYDALDPIDSLPTNRNPK